MSAILDLLHAATLQDNLLDLVRPRRRARRRRQRRGLAAGAVAAVAAGGVVAARQLSKPNTTQETASV